MGTSELNLVTGAFSYTGKYITQRLLSMGERVKTLTGHSYPKNPFGSQVTTSPFNFDNLSLLTESLQGVTTLYNTYWVRLSYRDVTFDRAVENSEMLIIRDSPWQRMRSSYSTTGQETFVSSVPSSTAPWPGPPRGAG